MSEEIVYSYSINQESLDPKECFEDLEMAEAVLNDMASGNRYAWFHAVVTASLGSFASSVTLGGNSYSSKEEWENDDYFIDLQRQAQQLLIEKIKAHKTELDKLIQSNQELFS